MTISSINSPHLSPSIKPEDLLLKGGLQKQLEKTGDENPKSQAAKKPMADTVEISPEGKALSKAPAPKEKADGAGEEGGNGQPGADEKKLKELKKELKEIESEVAELQSQAATDEAAKKELEGKNAEKQQIESQIALIEQRMSAQAA